MKKDVILGIGGLEHCAAAALMVDGKIVSAAEEERFNRIKNYAGFPSKAIEFCLKRAGLSINDVSDLAIGEVLSEAYSKRARYWLKQRQMGMTFADNILSSEMLTNSVKTSEIEAFLSRSGQTKKISWIPHHLSHAASAFYPYGLKECAFLSVDYLGEWDTIVGGEIADGKFLTYFSIGFPHSLGILYAAVTEYLGFNGLADEHKVTGLAPYGFGSFLQKMRDMVELKPDGTLSLNTEYFNLGSSLRNSKYDYAKFLEVFGPARNPDEALQKRHADIACSLQYLILESVIHLLSHLRLITRSDNLCYTGELALNCRINTAIAKSSLFKHMFVHPAPYDAGTAVGACFYVDRVINGRQRAADRQLNVYLGADYPVQLIRDALGQEDLVYRELSEDELINECVKDLAGGNIIGWFQDRMEWGHRALGNRSILADPRRQETADKINRSIKNREPFRPFAPSIRTEDAPEFFDYPSGIDTSYMLFLARAKAVTKMKAPAVVHVDGTSRIQTVSYRQNPLFWKLLAAFKRETGMPMLLNTSLNLNGEPIANTPQEALRCFSSSLIDVLYLGNFRVTRQKPGVSSLDATRKDDRAKGFVGERCTNYR